MVRLVVIDLIEQFKLPPRLSLEEEGNARGEDDGEDDADRFEEYLRVVSCHETKQSVVFRYGDGGGEEGGYFEDKDEAVAVAPSRYEMSERSCQSLYKFFPQRILFGRSENIVAVLFSAVRYFLCCQSVILHKYH